MSSRLAIQKSIAMVESIAWWSKISIGVIEIIDWWLKLSISMDEIIDCLLRIMVLWSKNRLNMKTDDYYGWKKDWCLKTIIQRFNHSDRFLDRQWWTQTSFDWCVLPKIPDIWTLAITDKIQIPREKPWRFDWKWLPLLRSYFVVPKLQFYHFDSR